LLYINVYSNNRNVWQSRNSSFIHRYGLIAINCAAHGRQPAQGLCAAAVVVSKSDGWRGNQAKENQIKQAIYGIVDNVEEVERIFAIVKQQHDY